MWLERARARLAWIVGRDVEILMAAFCGQAAENGRRNGVDGFVRSPVRDAGGGWAGGIRPCGGVGLDWGAPQNPAKVSCQATTRWPGLQGLQHLDSMLAIARGKFAKWLSTPALAAMTCSTWLLAGS